MLQENTIYTDQTSKDILLKNNELLSNIFWINILGFLALKTHGSHSKLDLYFKSEKVQLKTASDTSSDLVLIIKLVHDSGNIVISVANELTKLLALIKQDKITQIDETLLRDSLNKIVMAKVKPDPLVFKVVNGFLNGTITLKETIQPLYRFAKIHKICNEYIDIAKLMVNNIDDDTVVTPDPNAVVPDPNATALINSFNKKRGRPAGSTNKPKTAQGIVIKTQKQSVAVSSAAKTQKQIIDSIQSFNYYNKLDQILFLYKIWNEPLKTIKKYFNTYLGLKTVGDIKAWFLNNYQISPLVTGKTIKQMMDLADPLPLGTKTTEDIEPFSNIYLTPDHAQTIYEYLPSNRKDEFFWQSVAKFPFDPYNLDYYRMILYYNTKSNSSTLPFIGTTVYVGMENELRNNTEKFIKWGFSGEGTKLITKTEYYDSHYKTPFEHIISCIIVNTVYNNKLQIAKTLYESYTKYLDFKKTNFINTENLLLKFYNVDENSKDPEIQKYFREIGLLGETGFTKNMIVNENESIPKHLFSILWDALCGYKSGSPSDRQILTNIIGNKSVYSVLGEKNQIEEFFTNKPDRVKSTPTLKLIYNLIKEPEIDGFKFEFSQTDDNLIKWLSEFKTINNVDREMDNYLLNNYLNSYYYDYIIENPDLFNNIKYLFKLELLTDKMSIRRLFDFPEVTNMFSIINSIEENITLITTKLGKNNTLNYVFSQLKKVIPNITLSDLTQYETLFHNSLVYGIKNEDASGFSELSEFMVDTFNTKNFPFTSKETIDIFIKSFTEYYNSTKWKSSFNSMFLSLMKFNNIDEIISAIEKLIPSRDLFSAMNYYTFNTHESNDKLTNIIDNVFKEAETDGDAQKQIASSLFKDKSMIMMYINNCGNTSLLQYKQKALDFMLNSDATKFLGELKFDDVNDNSDHYTIDQKVLLMKGLASFYGSKNAHKDKGISRRLNKEVENLVTNYGDIMFDIFNNKKYKKEINKIIEDFGDRGYKVFKSLKDLVFIGPIVEEIIGSNTPIKPSAELTQQEVKNVLKFNNFEIQDIKLRRMKNETDVDYLERVMKQKDILELDELKLKVEPVVKTTDELKMKSAELYQYYTKNWAHGNKGLQILEEYTATVEFDEFKEFKKLYPNTEIIPVFHGTGSIAASMILRFGFKVLSEQAHRSAAKQLGTGFAGRMLGDGLYVGGFIDKTCGYIRDTKDWSNQNGQQGYLLECAAIMGIDKQHHRKAGDGGDSIKSIEYCLFNPRAQAKIIKAYKVKVIKRDIIKDWYEELFPNGITESNTQFPHFFKEMQNENNKLNELKGFKEFMLESTMPNKNIVTYTFHDDFIPVGKHEQMDVNNFIKTYCSKSSLIKVYECQDGNRVEMMTNAEECINITVPDTDEFMIKNPEGLFHQYLTFFNKLKK